MNHFNDLIPEAHNVLTLPHPRLHLPPTSHRQQAAGSPLYFPSVEQSAPRETLERIATAARVPVEQLSVVTLSSGMHPLANSILSYVGRFCDWQGSSTPMWASFRSFMMSSSSSCVSSSDDESGSGTDSDQDMPLEEMNRLRALVADDTSSDHRTTAAKVHRLNSRAARLHNRLHQKVHYSLGNGEALVTWPPPTPLRARALASAAVARVRARDGTSVASRHLLLPEYCGDEADPNDLESDAASITLFIARYGSSDLGISDDYRYDERKATQMSVASAAPMGAVRAFLSGVMKWERLHKPLVLRSGHLSMLSLSRYKLRPNDEGYWESENMRPSRGKDSVILPAGQMDEILADIRSFLSPRTRRWYSRHGVPQRRSFLFHGPPGTGKTSTIKVIASTFDRTCCFLNLASASFTNQNLADALESLPDDPLLVIEDVDALFVERRAASSTGLTFSGLLNALDGVISVDGVLTVLTTNHIERLDDAMLRAGRIDRRFFFGPPDRECVAQMFRTFYPSASDETVDEFVDAVWEWRDPATARSFASLQQLFIMKREVSAVECARSVAEFFETYFPRGVDIRTEMQKKEEEQKQEQQNQLRTPTASISSHTVSTVASSPNLTGGEREVPRKLRVRRSRRRFSFFNR